MPHMTFFLELASTYSYLSASRIDDLAASRGVTVEWTPFLLGPIFADHGQSPSPFTQVPIKGAYMWRDMERQCARYGLPYKKPGKAELEHFPSNSLKAARLAVVGLQQGWGKAFALAVYQAQFVTWRNISDPDVLSKLVTATGGDPKDALARAGQQTIKDALRANTARAQTANVFGAPSFLVGDELFWGDDRLEHAMDHAVKPGAGTG